ncbi:Carbonic anhydrase 2 [Pirellulimonas nuda]|uniref:Carbonic anhydrase n=1 Tax=Pirellulimonas nuda TaxID=2528009 RepID=A0A518D833_9BACT|nr:carbonate dehydratase [Pirellulimonas nuda]QDU87610.1 Carbonic anhydrase 2 [Pirellulimonas nuda]
MSGIDKLLLNNEHWANEVSKVQPGFFEELAKLQEPKYLWIGCSDSRVPANQILGLLPGEVFVHRNIANLCIHTDINCLSVLEYAVKVLKVKHVIVCGHYGCGGVATAMGDQPVGLIDNWLRHIRDVRTAHSQALSQIDQLAKRVDRLCELNVVEQVKNVASTSILQSAWAAGQEIEVHGLIYRLNDGRLHELGACYAAGCEVSETYRLCS